MGTIRLIGDFDRRAFRLLPMRSRDDATASDHPNATDMARHAHAVAIVLDFVKHSACLRDGTKSLRPCSTSTDFFCGGIFEASPHRLLVP
jgi:hypothetical protein